MRPILLLPALFLLAACEMTTTPTVTPLAVGDLHIGMRAQSVEGMEGTFHASQANDECIQMPMKGHGLLLMFEKSILNRIDVANADYKTPEGIHVGSSEKDTKAAYGKRLTVVPHKYETKGHYLNVISNGSGYVFETNGTKVTRIRVGKLPALNYVEGCS